MTALIVLSAVPASAQVLPLEVGNEWTYYTLIDPPNEPADTLDAGTSSVSGTVEIEGRAYFLFDHPEALADTVRADSEGRIWAWTVGGEHLYFDVTAADSAMYTFPDVHFQDSLEYVVTVRRDRTVETRAGTFENCIEFHFDIPEVLDEARIYYLAPGVGIVHTIGGMGEPSWLYEATVGGRPIPSGIAPDNDFSYSAYAYPNPTRTTANVRFDLERTAHATVRIYDVAGRRIATLVDRRLAAGPHNFSWPAQRRAAGVYFIVLESDEHRVTRALTITK